MRTLYLLGIALITFILSNSFIISPLLQDKESQKSEVKVNDEAWKKLHLVIERSPVDTVKAEFELFVRKNALKTTALNCNNGKYIGLSPADDYGYFHLAVLEINEGKIINLYYDEFKPNGDNKRTDVVYNHEMLRSGTSPSVAYPIYENQLIKNQDYMKVDAVTGATYSLYRFRMAVANALGKASEGKGEMKNEK